MYLTTLTEILKRLKNCQKSGITMTAGRSLRLRKLGWTANSRLTIISITICMRLYVRMRMWIPWNGVCAWGRNDKTLFLASKWRESTSRALKNRKNTHEFFLLLFLDEILHIKIERLLLINKEDYYDEFWWFKINW